MKGKAKKTKEVSMPMKCFVCGRERVSPEEGRIINGSWAEDILVPLEFWGVWVCSFRCYNNLVEWEKLETFLGNLQNAKSERSEE